MRTSRVSATPSSVFRNEQQYRHAGDISHKFYENPKRKKKMLPPEDVAAGNGKKKKTQRVLGDLTEVYCEDRNDLDMRHAMSETASKLSRMSKQKKRLNSYRSSI